MASVVNITVAEDDAPTPTWQITSDGSPLNLAGLTVTAVIKPSVSVEDDTTTGVYTLTVGSGLTVTDAAQGKVTLTIPSAVTGSPGQWYYKIRVTRDGKPQTAISGLIWIADA